jgi:hypothetical protein
MRPVHLALMPSAREVVRAQYNGTYGVLLQVQGHTVDAARELDHLAVHYVGQTVNTHDTVRYADDSAFVTGLRGTSSFSMRPLMISLISEGLSCCMLCCPFKLKISMLRPASRFCREPSHR